MFKLNVNLVRMYSDLETVQQITQNQKIQSLSADSCGTGETSQALQKLPDCISIQQSNQEYRDLQKFL